MRELLRRASHAAEHAPQQHADAHRFVANARLIFTPIDRDPAFSSTDSRACRVVKIPALGRSRARESFAARATAVVVAKRFLPRIQRIRALAMDGSSEGPRSATLSSRETRSTARRGSKRARSRAIAEYESARRGRESAIGVGRRRIRGAMWRRSGRVGGFACFYTMF